MDPYPGGVTIKLEPGIQDKDSRVIIPTAFIEIEVPNIKQECCESSVVLDRTDGENILYLR